MLRKNGFAIKFVSSERELARVLSHQHPVFIIHLYGEDHTQIASSKMDALERKAVAVFNGSRIGPVLADKLTSHQAFEAGGVLVPALKERGGFVRLRSGTGLPTFMEQDTGKATSGSDVHIQTEFIDTSIKFENRRYYTTIRLLCVDDIVLNTYLGARDVQDDSLNVHAYNTPLDPVLIEHLHRSLAATRTKEFSLIAKQLFAVLGHGFYAHDLLIASNDGSIFLCESGFKFDAEAYWAHHAPIAAEIPSQASLFPTEALARRSAQVFQTQCDTLLSERP